MRTGGGGGGGGGRHLGDCYELLHPGGGSGGSGSSLNAEGHVASPHLHSSQVSKIHRTKTLTMLSAAAVAVVAAAAAIAAVASAKFGVVSGQQQIDRNGLKCHWSNRHLISFYSCFPVFEPPSRRLCAWCECECRVSFSLLLPSPFCRTMPSLPPWPLSPSIELRISDTGFPVARPRREE